MSLPTIARFPGYPDSGERARTGAGSSSPSSPAPALSALAEGGADRAPSTRDSLVHARGEDLLATVDGRRKVAKYLACLELGGYGHQPAMAAYITGELARLAPHLTPEAAGFWLDTLKTAIGDRALGLRMQDACACIDEALRHLTSAANTQGGTA